MKKSVWYSSAVLIIYNFYLLIGILFLGWDVRNIGILFLLEIGFIGFFFAIKILILNYLDGKIRKKSTAKKFSEFIIFFTIFSLAIFYWFYAIGGGMFKFFELDYSDLYKVRFAAALIFFSHGFSFFINFILNKEYKNRLFSISHLNEVVGFFNRIMSFLWASALIIAVFYLPIKHIIFALLLVLIKGYFDLKAHIKEHDSKNYEKILEPHLDSNQLLAELRKPSRRK